MTQEAAIDVDAVLKRVKLLRFGAQVVSDVALAEALQIPRATIASWRRRKSIPLDHLLKIIRPYDISIEWLIRGNGEKYPKSIEGMRDHINLDVFEIALHDAYERQSETRSELGFHDMQKPEEYAPLIILIYYGMIDSINGISSLTGESKKTIIAKLRLQRNMSPAANPTGIRHLVAVESEDAKG